MVIFLEDERETSSKFLPLKWGWPLSTQWWFSREIRGKEVQNLLSTLEVA